MWNQSLVVIRERGFGDILDLALHVLRDNAPAIFFWGTVGVLPFAALNHLLLWELRQNVIENAELINLYLVFYFWLVSWEMPLATAGVTLLLGQRMFHARARHTQVARQWLGSLPQLFLLQGMVRGLLHMFCVSFFVPYLFWPYLNEVILLERNPLMRRGRVGTMGRSVQLHQFYIGEMMLRWLAAMGAGVVLCTALAFGLGTVVAMFRTQFFPFSWWLAGFFPAAVWITVVFMAVVRFLSYLDLRIRKEGWEIELQLKSEAARLARAEGGVP